MSLTLGVYVPVHWTCWLLTTCVGVDDQTMLRPVPPMRSCEKLPNGTPELGEGLSSYFVMKKETA